MPGEMVKIMAHAAPGRCRLHRAVTKELGCASLRIVHGSAFCVHKQWCIGVHRAYMCSAPEYVYATLPVCACLPA